LKAEEELIMLRVLVLGLTLAFAAGASAQLYRWVDKDGRVRYSDTPPPGVKATNLSPSPGYSAPPPPAAGDAAAKDTGKGPLTPAQQEAEYRKRQVEAQKSREKQEQASRDLQAKQDNCARAQESLAGLESGQRIARTNATGERYYIDDDQRAAETEKARQSVNSWCN
jgi:hypothetical protein